MTASKETKQIINISQVIEERKNKGFVVNLLFWTFLLMILEGYDIGSISFAAPLLMKQWHIAPGPFGVVFSAGTFGLMIGGFIFGYLGDRLGRKKSIMISVFLFSVFTLLTILTTTLSSLVFFRFLVGLGLGGTVPLSIVLVNELAPKKLKGRWVSIMFAGFPLGMALGGIIAAKFLVSFDWHSIFIFGGIAPLILLIFIYFMLPESLKFLAIKNKNRAEIIKGLAKIEPSLKVQQDAEFTVEKVEQNVAFSTRLLFAGNLRYVTPLIWIVSILSSSVVYFLNSWMPKLLMSSGLSMANASLTTSLYQIAGLLGGPAVGWLLDKYGLKACVIFPVLGGLGTALLGSPIQGSLLMLIVFCAGFFVIGTQGILTAATPIFYHTSYRSKGNGIAMGIAKIGSIGGPVIGGILIAQLPLKHLFFVNSAAIFIAAVLFLILGFLSKTIYKEMRGEEHGDPPINISTEV